MKKWITIILIVVAVFLLLHSTPNIALRTHVFFLGYPTAAITSGIIEDEFHNKIDKQKFVELNGKAYTLTNPPR